MQDRVVCTTTDKTVLVEEARLAPHPKYDRHVRIKKYRANGLENRFKVGDFIQLDKSCKTKAFVPVLIVARNAPKPIGQVAAGVLSLLLQSQEEVEPVRYKPICSIS